MMLVYFGPIWAVVGVLTVISHQNYFFNPMCFTWFKSYLYED